MQLAEHASGEASMWELAGWVSQKGSLAAGHYWAHVGDGEGGFAKCNDRFVTQGADWRGEKEVVYFLEYQRKGRNPTAGQDESESQSGPSEGESQSDSEEKGAGAGGGHRPLGSSGVKVARRGAGVGLFRF